MPNRNANSIEIHTDVNPKEFMSKTVDWWRSLHFNKLLPIPKWKWSVGFQSDTRWTKRDIYNSKEKITTGWFQITKEWGRYHIHWSFDTARAPPIQYYEELQAVLRRKDDSSDIVAYYNEPGCAFFGKRDNWDDEEYEYAGNVHWIDWLEEYLITLEWDALDIYTEIAGDTFYTPETILDDMDEYDLSDEERAEILRILYDNKLLTLTNTHMYIVSSNYHKGRTGWHYRCQVFYVNAKNITDVTDQVAGAFWFTMKKNSLYIRHWSGTWYMRIKEAIQKKDSNIIVRDVSVFNQ